MVCFGGLSLASNYLISSNSWCSGWRHWVSTVPGEHCQKIAVSIPTQAGQRFTWSKTWWDRQQLWKAVITGDTVTFLSEAAVNIWRSEEETTQKLQDEDKKSAINKELILRLRSLISKWFQLKIIHNDMEMNASLSNYSYYKYFEYSFMALSIPI